MEGTSWVTQLFLGGCFFSTVRLTPVSFSNSSRVSLSFSRIASQTFILKNCPQDKRTIQTFHLSQLSSRHAKDTLIWRIQLVLRISRPLWGDMRPFWIRMVTKVSSWGCCWRFWNANTHFAGGSQSSLQDLDYFRYVEAPAQFSKATGRSMDLDDVLKLLEWKL